MRIWMLRRWDEDRPRVFLTVGRLLLIARFGVEHRPSFSERMQGTNNVPVRWRYLFGRRLSIYTEMRPRG